MSSVTVTNLHKEFGVGTNRMVALDNVNLAISGNQFVSIVGPSGCGKSTLLNILSGIEHPTSGTVSILGASGEAKLGYVFQSARLLPWRTVVDNLLFVQEQRSPEARHRCMNYLEMVGLGTRADAFPSQLSGGMQQRVGIARAFSIEPDVLLMDEPFSHLDAITARGLRRELHDMWRRTDKLVVFVTHDIGEGVELSNRILVFGQGGRLLDDIDIKLPFPRDPADENVAIQKAKILRKFEETGLIAS